MARSHIPFLKSLTVGVKPKEVILPLSEAMLHAFAENPLINKYDVYQHLMTYWMETMKDDVYIISEDGWKAEVSLVNEKKQEWDCDLVLKPLVIQRYFAEEQARIDRLIDERDAITRQREEMEEEQSGEEGLLEEVKNDKGKISKGAVQKRIKTIQDDPDGTEELEVLNAYLALIEQESKANKAIKETQKGLDKQVFARYKELSEEEIKTLVVDDKWMTSIHQEVKTEMERISQRLTQRIKELAERYTAPLPQLTADVEELSTKIDAHLQRMGFVW